LQFCVADAIGGHHVDCVTQGTQINSSLKGRLGKAANDAVEVFVAPFIYFKGQNDSALTKLPDLMAGSPNFQPFPGIGNYLIRGNTS
jgi:hypothetical protein